MDVSFYKSILAKTNTRVSIVLVSTCFAIIASSLEAANVGLLVYLVQGFIDQDYSFIIKSAFYRYFLGNIPFLSFESTKAGLLSLTVVIFFAVSLKNIFQYFGLMLGIYQARRFTSRLRFSIFERYLSFGKLFFDRSSVSNMNHVLISCSSEIGNQLILCQSVIANFFNLIAYVCVMLLISWQLTLLFLICFPILGISIKWLVKRMKATSSSYWTSLMDLQRQSYNALSSIPLVKMHNNESGEISKFRRLINNLLRIEFSMDKKQHLISPVQEMIMLCLVLLMLIVMSELFSNRGKSFLGSFLVYFFVMRRASHSFSSINSYRAILAKISGALQNIKEIYDNNEKFFVRDGSKEFLGLRDRIFFSNLTFEYIPGIKVLNQVTFSVIKGQTTALVGHSGAGKSTIAHLLIRFYDLPKSMILIDGVDITDFKISSLRERMALVSQDAILFNGTLRENLVYGFGNSLSDEMIWASLDKAKLLNFVKLLPNKLETLIGDRGVRLSGGEKQRLSIARAILKNAEILILDEATSSLDSITERMIQEAIADLVKDKTSICIAHRLATIKSADQIIVLGDGAVIESGSLNQLLDRKGAFFRYWEEQKFY